jgi:hypothetical protein
MDLTETQQREKNDYRPDTYFADRTDVGDLSRYADRRRAELGPSCFWNCPHHQQRDDFQTVVGKENKPDGGPPTDARDLPYECNKDKGSDHLKQRRQMSCSEAEHAG